jgi:hypothetical protein
VSEAFSHFISVASRTLWQRIVGKNQRDRQRRKGQFLRFISWLFVGSVVLLVLLLVGQFVTRVFVSPPVTSEAERTDLWVKKGERIQLTVLNGSGEPNIARKFTDFLRARKFDVVEIANYSRQDLEHTMIVDRISDSLASEKVAYALGIERSRIVREFDSQAFVHAEIIIGKDFLALKPMQ